MAHKLKKMQLTSVDLVRAGANQEAHIRLSKSDTPQEGAGGPTEGEKNIFKRFIAWLRENPTEDASDLTDTDEIEKAYTTFDQVNDSRESRDLLWRYTDALTCSIHSIVDDRDLDKEAKKQMMNESLEQFSEAMRGLFGKLCAIQVPSDEVKCVGKSAPDYDVIHEISKSDTVVEIEKFNPYHGKDGRFTSANGGGATAFTIRTKDPSKQHFADNAAAKEAEKNTSIQVDGPGATKAFVDDYVSKHPEIEEEAKKYKDVLDNVRNFQKNNPNAEEGTYSAVTGELVNPTSGFAVTFHQNQTADNPYGAYDSDTYAKMCAIAKKELGSSDVYIGYFGNAEVSFNCSSAGKAMEFAVQHNQHSIFNCSTFEVVENITKYNPKTNPIEGH
jgi:hypothetical protein